MFVIIIYTCDNTKKYLCKTESLLTVQYFRLNRDFDLTRIIFIALYLNRVLRNVRCYQGFRFTEVLLYTQIKLIQLASYRINTKNRYTYNINYPMLINRLRFSYVKLLYHYMTSFKFNTNHNSDTLVTYCTSERCSLTRFFYNI